MKHYIVQNDEGLPELLEVAAESDLGFHVRISVPRDNSTREYQDFIARNLFEALVKAGTLEPVTTEARAG